MVNNDIVAIALTSLILWGLVAGMKERFPLRLCAVLGIALGLNLLSKATAITVAPIIAAGVVSRCRLARLARTPSPGAP